MRPTPRKLALLMSVAGLGLSLSEASHAKGDASANGTRVPMFGLQSVPSVGNGDAGDGFATLPPGPLDATLSADDMPALSEEDRAAVALAMVLMAEPPLPGKMLAMPDVARAASRWEFSAEFRRDFGDAPSPRESFGAPPVAPTAPVQSHVQAAPADETVDGDADQSDLAEVVPAPPVESRAEVPAHPAVAHVDLDLSAGVGTLSGIDLNIELAPALDINLDLSPGLDLNLELATDLDLRLDRPPVFAVSKLRPVGSAKKLPAAALASEPVSPSCTASEPIVALRDMPQAVPRAVAPAPAPAPIQAEASPAVQALPKVAPKIVVTSHADRALRSLEALLANDDAPAGRFGAQTEEVFVTTHAEKALLMLASTCAGEESEAAPADPLPRISKVEVAASASSCKPGLPSARASAPARRSPIGAGVVAMNQSALDKVRGGFDGGIGLHISFGIERAVYINGALVTTTALNVSDVGNVSGGQGPVPSAVAASSNLTLIQNGAGNTFVTGPVSASTLGTVVQNTLNDQKIQTVTAINATVNSLQLVRAQNFQSTLRGALIDSLRR